MALFNLHNLFLTRDDLDTVAEQNGVATGVFQLLSGAVATTVGEWTRFFPFHKGSFEVEGITTATVVLFSSNSPTCPLNGKTLTIGGTVTTGDTLSLTINAAGVSVTASYTTVGGDTVDTIATNFAAAITAAIKAVAQTAALATIDYLDQALYTELPLLQASASGAVITLTWAYPLEGVQVNVATVTGSATETVTVAEYDSGAGFEVPNCSLTANGNVVFDQPCMWIKAKVTSYSASTTGGISANIVGSIP